MKRKVAVSVYLVLLTIAIHQFRFHTTPPPMPFFIFWSESFAVQKRGIISDPGLLVVQFGDHLLTGTSGLFTPE